MAFQLGLVDVAIITVTAYFLLYMYASRYRNYWKSQNVVHEKFSLMFGPAKRLLLKPVCLSDQERYKKYGRLFGAYERGKPCLFVAEPDLIKQILVKDFQHLPNRMLQRTSNPLVDSMMVIAAAERWRTIRPATTPAFSTGKLRKMNAMIQDCARITSTHLEEAAEKNQDIDVKWFFGHYSLDVIARCAFGTRLDSHTDSTNEFVAEVNKTFSARRMSWRVLVATLFAELARCFRFSIETDGEFEYFKNVCQRIINERRQAGHVRVTFLQLMMDAQEGTLTSDEDSSAENENRVFEVGSETELASANSSNRLTEIEAMAQCVLFFLAGQETTSTTIAFTAYLLALNPNVQEKLRKEVDECIAKNGPEPSFDTISKLKYLHCVVSEALRLYPPSTRLERSGYDDYVLGDTEIKLPKDGSIIIPIYAMHHDPAMFPDPDGFTPERFSDENVESIRPYSYLPFGAGPRNCIGMRLALQSVKLCLLHSLHRVQFVLTEKTKVPLKVKKGRGVLTAEDITVGIRRRPDSQV
ncbi:cytochrome P450 3A24-like isoform X1 [Dermacentor silvarum]|uniref:cytochrome P450 3A24-like isoform X1 n=2 Tax=Dermacentor silvarum TaxID=543639 RepID=UPI0021016C33|nr:cytochrome P450 3A24-like isoform X1 [Dermacentor silvarum]